MEIILRFDVNKVGKAGSVVKVKDGFARNYLIPQGKAYPHTDAYINRYNEEIKSKKYREIRIKNSAEALRDELKDKVFTFTMKAGEDGKLFGSVTSQNIADRLTEKGYEIDKKKISLEENLKSLGDHVVPYKLHSDVSIEIKVKIVAEEEA